MRRLREAVGFVETRGLPAAIAAADAMVKAANVRIIDYKQVGSGLVCITVQGEVAAVQAATQAGEQAALQVGEVISVNVIPRPNSEVARMLPMVDEPGRE